MINIKGSLLINKKGYEYIFSAMLDLGEKELKPLFEKEAYGTINFLVVSHDSLDNQKEELLRRGYTRDNEGDYDNVQHPLETNYIIDLPEGFKQVYGEVYDAFGDMRKEGKSFTRAA